MSPSVGDAEQAGSAVTGRAEGDSIVARWKRMDAPNEVNNEIKQFTFTVTLTDKGTWKELDKRFDQHVHRQDQPEIHFIGLRQNNQTGEVGVVSFKFNTTSVKQPIRDYLGNCGWKKAALFG